MTDTARPDLAPERPGAGWGWMLAYGLLSIAIGIVAFLSPFSATLAATVVVAFLFLVAGLTSVVAGIAGRGHVHRLYSVLFGLLSVAVGLLMLFRPLSGALSLTVLAAIWLASRGVLELVWAARHRRHRVSMVLLGLLNIGLAALIVWTVPFSALTLPGTVLGLSFLFGGVAASATALAHKKGAPAFSAG